MLHMVSCHHFIHVVTRPTLECLEYLVFPTSPIKILLLKIHPKHLVAFVLLVRHILFPPKISGQLCVSRVSHAALTMLSLCFHTLRGYIFLQGIFLTHVCDSTSTEPCT